MKGKSWRVRSGKLPRKRRRETFLGESAKVKLAEIQNKCLLAILEILHQVVSSSFHWHPTCQSSFQTQIRKTATSQIQILLFHTCVSTRLRTRPVRSKSYFNYRTSSSRIGFLNSRVGVNSKPTTHKCHLLRNCRLKLSPLGKWRKFRKKWES